MILTLENGKQLRGDLILSAILRSDLAPIPVTLEAEIRAGEEGFDGQLAEGKLLTLATGDTLHIVKSERIVRPYVQGSRILDGFRVTALLAACLPVAYVRSRAIVKEDATLSAIYRAAGASVSVKSDFPVKRFSCLIGDVPSFQIARVLQEEGGVVRWKSKRLEFLPLRGLNAADAVRTLPGRATEDEDAGFLERHAVPWFFSLDSAGGFIYGNRDKPRSVRYAPFKTEIQLRNMTRALIRRRVVKTGYDQRICAGDCVTFEDGAKYTVLTAAHCFSNGSEEGGASDQHTRLWLGEVDE